MCSNFILLILLQDDVRVETEEGLKRCKLIAVHAGLEKGDSVEEQLKLLRSKDTSISKVPYLSGRKNVWDIPQVKRLEKKPTSWCWDICSSFVICLYAFVFV